MKSPTLKMVVVLKNQVEEKVVQEEVNIEDPEEVMVVISVLNEAEEIADLAVQATEMVVQKEDQDQEDTEDVNSIRL